MTNAVVFRFTNYIETDPKQKTWWKFGALVVVVFLGNLAANMAASSVDRERVMPERRIVLLGERRFPHWASFTDGFKLVLGDAKLGKLSRDADESLLGELLLERNGKDFGVKVVSLGLPDAGREAQNQDEEKKLISKLAGDPNVLMIIGFVTSTKAELAFEALEESRVHVWPTIILPMATASKLVKDHNAKGDKPIIRIVPSNASQVESIAKEIVASSGGNGTVSLAIFRDHPNYTYSLDLGDLLRRRIESGHVTVVFDGSIGPDGPGSYVPESFVKLRPDYIVFLGMLDTGIPLVRQIQAMKSYAPNGKPWNPVILLSDGSVEKEISGYARTDELQHLQGFFPHGEPQLYADHFKEVAFDSPSFTMFGHDAAMFAHEILQTALDNKSELDRQSVGQALIAVRKRCNKGDSPIAKKVLVGNYGFDEFGDVTGLQYQVWNFDGKRWSLKSKNGASN
jgi:ABC-type branched-subunit amino acid transport system substrate-binding protein